MKALSLEKKVLLWRIFLVSKLVERARISVDSRASWSALSSSSTKKEQLEVAVRAELTRRRVRVSLGGGGPEALTHTWLKWRGNVARRKGYLARGDVV